MPPLTLPPRSPATIRAFWLTISGLVGLSAGTALAVQGRDARRLLAAVPIAAAVATPGVAAPQRVAVAYRAWNRLGQITARSASAWVTRVAFEVLLAERDRGELPEMSMRTTGDSAWRARRSQPAAAYAHQDARSVTDGGLDAFDRFAQQPEHAWATSLRPLVRLLDALQTEDDADELPPSDIYTLY